MQLAVSRILFVVWVIWNLMATSTDRHCWTRVENEELLSCYYSSRPSVRGYRKRLYDLWHQRNGSNALYSTFNEQRLCGQAQSLLKRNYFTDVELKLLESRVLDNGHTTSAVVEPPSLLEATGHEVTSALQPSRDSPEPAPEVFQMVFTEYQSELASRVLSYMNSNSDRTYLPPLRGRFIPNLKELVANMNTVLLSTNASSLTELCNLCYSAVRVVTEECGVKIPNPTSNSSPPPWEIRILLRIKKLKQDLSQLRELICGRLKSQQKINNLVSRYNLQSRSAEEVCEELHQTVKSLSHRLKRYRHKQSCRQQNKLKLSCVSWMLSLGS